MSRTRKRTSITKGGCERCSTKWRGINAHMLAGKHHRDTGHPTWSQTSGGERHLYATATDQPRML